MLALGGSGTDKDFVKTTWERLDLEAEPIPGAPVIAIGDSDLI
jgi:hypothetical protein